MPTLITYERERLSEAQYQALGVYFARKRLKERANENGVSSHTDGENTTNIQDATPAKPSAEEIREKKEKSLNDTKEKLAELESMLCKLKEKKHELFEELKLSLVHSKKEKERQMQPCFPSPFMPHPISPGAAMMNVPTFRPGKIFEHSTCSHKLVNKLSAAASLMVTTRLTASYFLFEYQKNYE